jgi:predicted nucleotidyltransferase
VLDLRVFGSRARGDAAPDSDLDVFIELDGCDPELRQRISEIGWEVGFEDVSFNMTCSHSSRSWNRE